MKYNELNATQKRCVDAYIQVQPDLETRNSISRKEVESIFFKLKAERTETSTPIGYPMWIVKGRKVGRGEYQWPGPKAEIREVTPVENQSEVYREFLADLQQYGITL